MFTSTWCPPSGGPVTVRSSRTLRTNAPVSYMETTHFTDGTGTIAARARRVWKAAMHVLGHVATTVVGGVLFILGLGLTMSVVFVAAGILSLALGVSLIVGAVFAHQMGGP